jgi:hypothetical protein
MLCNGGVTFCSEIRIKHINIPCGENLEFMNYIPYILESNPHHFYSFRGLKKSDAD